MCWFQYKDAYLETNYSQKAVSTVIAPHGITDLIHANQHNITSELLQINGFTLVYSHVLTFY